MDGPSAPCLTRSADLRCLAEPRIVSSPQNHRSRIGPDPCRYARGLRQPQRKTALPAARCPRRAVPAAAAGEGGRRACPARGASAIFLQRCRLGMRGPIRQHQRLHMEAVGPMGKLLMLWIGSASRGWPTHMAISGGRQMRPGRGLASERRTAAPARRRRCEPCATCRWLVAISTGIDWGGPGLNPQPVHVAVAIFAGPCPKQEHHACDANTALHLAFAPYAAAGR